VSPDSKRQAVVHVMETMNVSERRACRALEQPRSTQRYEKKVADDEAQLRERIVELAGKYGRYGYRRITGLLRNEGWKVNHKRVERIWREEGLKVPQKQAKPEGYPILPRLPPFCNASSMACNTLCRNSPTYRDGTQ